MTKFIVLLLITISTFPATAFAADFQVRNPSSEFPPALTFGWDGFYLGGYAGGSFGQGQLKDTSNLSFPLPSIGTSGFAGGGVVGYNITRGQFVLGGEAEFGFSARDGNSSTFLSLGSPRGQSLGGDTVARVRARGGLAIDRWFLFAAGGLSLANSDLKIANLASGFSQDISQELVGFNIGGGVEYALAKNWIGRVEYIYDGYGRQGYDFHSSGIFGSRSMNFAVSTARAALEYKF